MTTPPAQEDEREAAQLIAARLEERADVPVQQIAHIIRLCGRAQAEQWADRAIAQFAQARPRTNDGSRERTLGGTFFWLAKQEMKPEHRARIWPPPNRRRSKGEKQEAQRAAADAAAALGADTAPAFDYSQRKNVFIPLQRGKAETVKVTLLGRPDQHRIQQNLVILAMQNDRPPSLPAGLPAVPPEPTDYVIYAVPKQWRKVADALANDQSDRLIVQGWAAYDPELQGMAVWATSLTTVGLDRARRLDRSPG
jgi:hypothetical protein